MTVFRFSPRPNRAGEIRWQQWGDEAFAEAQRRDVPVLLAISAVWCHWCHVMDETSYSTPEIITAINERFVAIRVDNDERPDVNRRYNMGGWPSTVFLTPDGEIVHGGTYIPPQQMYQTVVAVADLWRDKRDDLTQRVAAARAHEETASATQPGDLSPEIVDLVRALVSGQYDPQYGGFGREPKFPQPKLLLFLLNEYGRHRAPDVATMLRTTLDAMRASGMYDHVEGGFFRYATQRDWNVPHYEKMLEENAELLSVYAIAHRSFPDRGYDGVVRDVIRWMDAVLYQPEVQLWSGSQDADEHYYTLDAEARAEHDAPFVDRTIYTSWNALAARSYLRAADALDDETLRARARGAAHAIETRLRDASGALCRSLDETGRLRSPDLLDDAAAYLGLLTELGDVPTALGVARRMRERLEDPDHGGFFDTPDRPEPGRLARRERPIEENAVASDALLRLASLAADETWREIGVRALRAFVGEYRQWGQFAASYADAVARALRDPVAVAVVGTGEAADGLWRAARATVDADAVLQRLDPVRDAALLVDRGLPADRVAAYVCVGATCSAPLTDEGSLRRELEHVMGEATAGR